MGISPLLQTIGPLGFVRSVGFDPKIGAPWNYFDFKHGLSMFFQNTGGTTPLTTDGQRVQYVSTLIGQEALTGVNTGWVYKASVNLGAGYIGPCFQTDGGNQSLRGSGFYNSDETMLCLFSGVGWGGGLKGVMGKKDNVGQLFYNGDTLGLWVYNQNGSFVDTGLIMSGFYKVALQHSGANTTRVKIAAVGGAWSSWFTTTSAGSNWFNPYEFSHGGGSGFGSPSGWSYVAGLSAHSLYSDALIDQYFNYWLGV